MVDFFLEYDPENTHIDDPAGELPSAETTHPAGLSGGGVFIAPSLPDDESIWSPLGAKLVAIQSGFLPGKRLLRVKRAEHILRWIAEYRKNPEVEMDPARCGAIGINGKQCRRKLRSGERLCWQHAT